MNRRNNNILKIILAVFGCGILIVWYAHVSETKLKQIKYLPSPYGAWVAIVSVEQYGNSFGPIYYAVTLQPQIKVGQRINSKKVFEIEAISSPPNVEWRNKNEIVLKIII